MSDVDDGSEAVGYCQPPVGTRFKKGQSGNPNGRPKGRRPDIPHDHLLGQMVVVREGGRERRVTAAEAFLLHITQRGMEGDSASARASLAAIEEADARRRFAREVLVIVCRIVSPGSVGCAIDALGMAHKLNKHSEQAARYNLDPWIVEAALARFGPRQLTIEEQRTVFESTRSPAKVRWPAWWTVFE